MEYETDHRGPEVDLFYRNEDDTRVRISVLRADSFQRVQGIQEAVKMINKHEPHNSVEVTEERETKIREIMADRGLSFRDVIELAFEEGLDEIYE